MEQTALDLLFFLEKLAAVSTDEHKNVIKWLWPGLFQGWHVFPAIHQTTPTSHRIVPPLTSASQSSSLPP